MSRMAPVPMPLLVFVSAVIISILAIASIHICIADCNNGNISLRAMIIISLLLELFVMAFQFLSSSINDDNVRVQIKLIPHMFYYCNMATVSVIGYYLIRAPEKLHKFASVVNRLWLFITILFIISILFSAAFFAISESMFYESIHFLGFYMYIISAATTILAISLKLNAQIKQTIENFNKMENSNFQDYMYGVPKTPNMGTANTNSDTRDTKSTKSPTPTNKDSIKQKQMIHSLEKVSKVNKTKRKVVAAMFLSIFVVLCAVFAMYWQIYTIQLDNNSISAAPFVQLDTFIIHYVIMITIYLTILVYYWISPVIVVRNSCCCMIRRDVKCKKAIDTDSNINPPNNHSVDVANALSFDIENQLTLNELKSLKRYLELTKQKPSPMSTHTVFSYTDATAAALSVKHLNTELHKINDAGDIIGKRGAKKILRNKSEDRRVTFAATVAEEAERKREPQELDLVDYVLDGLQDIELRQISAQITRMSQSVTSKNTYAFVDDILPTISLTDMYSQQVTTVVFEFDALCTQIAKLKKKSEISLDAMNLMQKQLYFGGAERTDMLKNWLGEIQKPQRGVQFFVNSEEKSKKIVTLLKMVGLLRFFVAKNMNNPNKLISNIIGWDHKLSKETNSRKHLILLQLLVQLDKSHDQLLYVGNDKNIIEHLNKANICRTYLCHAKGLTNSDMDKIQRKYFD